MRRKGIAWVFAAILGLAAGVAGIEYSIQGKTSTDAGWCRSAACAPSDGIEYKGDLKISDSTWSIASFCNPWKFGC